MHVYFHAGHTQGDPAGIERIHIVGIGSAGVACGVAGKADVAGSGFYRGATTCILGSGTDENRAAFAQTDVSACSACSSATVEPDALECQRTRFGEDCSTRAEATTAATNGTVSATPPADAGRTVTADRTPDTRSTAAAAEATVTSIAAVAGIAATVRTAAAAAAETAVAAIAAVADIVGIATADTTAAAAAAEATAGTGAAIAIAAAAAAAAAQPAAGPANSGTPVTTAGQTTAAAAAAIIVIAHAS